MYHARAELDINYQTQTQNLEIKSHMIQFNQT